MTFHKEFRYGVAELAERSFTPLHVRNNPPTRKGRAMQKVKYQPTGSPTNNTPDTTENSEQKEDLLIHELWQIWTCNNHDMRVVNTDAISHRNKSPEKCLQKVEKKMNYLESCLQKCCNLSPFVVLVDRLLGVEVEATLKHISIRLATKWKYA